jgi:hypothetical protein
MSDVTAAQVGLPPPSSTRLNPMKNFEKKFSDIIQRWANNIITTADKKYLEYWAFYGKEFLLVTEEFKSKQSIELINHHIKLIEYPTALHGMLGGLVDQDRVWRYSRRDAFYQYHLSFMR